ncbi:NiFeSe hydrogenase small subunit [Maridesulfovibrio sp.]|uniref:NiFeSe hydrogenase small subunit n=1 Tax=Maridesulfovibrio sp. TaxID=2795000 RepID=UPI002A18A929|nr:NiFeSe hydrogenase small subunit [Maridesulfovibrio sp.]
MSLTRRDFVKMCTGTVAGFGISQMFNPSVVHALKKFVPNVFWLQGQGCTGCSVSILNSVHPSIAEVLLDVINLDYHPTIMGSEGHEAWDFMMSQAEANKGKYIVIVEGAVPTAENGHFCIVGADANHKEYTMAEATLEMAKNAAVVVNVGTCSAYGGIPAAEGNLTGSMSVTNFLAENGVKTPVVNIPGCPPHPDWMVGTLVVAINAIEEKGLQGGLAEVVKILDDNGRPKPFFGENIHDNCPYLEKFENDEYAEIFTDPVKCRYELGCKGPSANSDCFKRKWNGGVNWCVENSVCIGCVEPGFPDEMSPFYEAG